MTKNKLICVILENSNTLKAKYWQRNLTKMSMKVKRLLVLQIKMHTLKRKLKLMGIIMKSMIIKGIKRPIKENRKCSMIAWLMEFLRNWMDLHPWMNFKS